LHLLAVSGVLEKEALRRDLDLERVLDVDGRTGRDQGRGEDAVTDFVTDPAKLGMRVHHGWLAGSSVSGEARGAGAGREVQKRPRPRRWHQCTRIMNRCKRRSRHRPQYYYRVAPSSRCRAIKVRLAP